jgi:hypothetical protein
MKKLIGLAALLLSTSAMAEGFIQNVVLTESVSSLENGYVVPNGTINIMSANTQPYITGQILYSDTHLHDLKVNVIDVATEKIVDTGKFSLKPGEKGWVHSFSVHLSNYSNLGNTYLAIVLSDRDATTKKTKIISKQIFENKIY